MRALFIKAIVVLGLCGCSTFPYIDIRYPTYIVIDKSLYAECGDGGVGAACRDARVSVVEEGINDWLKHFDAKTRPKIRIVRDGKSPSQSINQPIPIKVSGKGCKGISVSQGLIVRACYEPPGEIVLLSLEDLFSSIIAHELGHVFGLEHTTRLNTDGTFSIMSEPMVSDYVTPVDIEELCKAQKCPPHEVRWNSE